MFLQSLQRSLWLTHSCSLRAWLFQVNYVIYNGNRTEWSPIRSVIIQVINKIGRLVNHENYNRQNWKTKIVLPINRNLYNFRKTTIHLGQISVVETKSKWKIQLWKFHYFFRISGCCCGCDQFCDWWIWLKGLSMIQNFNCLIIANCLITLSN